MFENFPKNVDWKRRQGTPVKKALNAAERLSLAVEAPFARLISEQTLNPLYHTGTITVFLLLIVIATGVYLTLFFQFGFEASYEAVSRLEGNFIGRLMRALHRYASGAAIFTTLLHGWRTFFQDRFRGPRWLAWVSGVVMAAFLWLVGITGYWLIWDERAALITASFANLIDGSRWGLAFLFRYIVVPEQPTGWPFMLLILTVHIGLTLGMAALFWLHVKRLNRPKILPAQGLMAAVGGVLLLGALIVPVGMLPMADGLPGRVPIDWFFLFFLPVSLTEQAPILFMGAVGATLLIAAVPWVLVRPVLEPVEIHPESCTGCTLCAKDCPYDALTMVDRDDDTIHQLIAVVDPAMCVSCGVCVGSCPPRAISMGDEPINALWTDAVAKSAGEGDDVRVVFTCERHAMHGGRSTVMADQPITLDGQRVAVVPLTCVGMAQPNLLTKALDAGAAEVQVIGCPPEDCANREGNLWLGDRVGRDRLPKLRRSHIDAPIRVTWAAPSDFERALRGDTRPVAGSAYKLTLPQLSIGNFIPSLVVLAVVLVGAILLSQAPFEAYAAEQSMLTLTLEHRSGVPIAGIDEALSAPPGDEVRLIISIDDETVFDERYPAGDLIRVYEQIPVNTGVHDLRIVLYDNPDQPQVLVDGPVFMPAGDALRYAFGDTRASADVRAGERLFNEQATGTNVGCKVCHSLEEGGRLVGPPLYGIADRAGDRIPGLSAEEYLYQSITAPNSYIVEGYPEGVMPADYSQRLSEDDIEDLVAYLMTLHEE